MTELISPTFSFEEDADGLVIKREQDITDEFLAQCAAKRDASKARASEYHEAASIPVSVIELWQRQGFDFWSAPAREVIAKLRRDGLEAFITTTKNI